MDNSTRNDDEYLDCSEYTGHSSSTVDDFVLFTKDGSYYFAMVSPDGNVVLRSESYPTTNARDNGVQSVLKNRAIAERYTLVPDNGGYLFSLKAGNHKEIARSCPFATEEEAWATYHFLKDGSADYPWLKKVEATAAAISTTGLQEDEYLACDEYKGHEATADGITTFQKDGSYFFSVVGATGDVLLRSESYPSVGARDNGVESVIKNRPIQERYSVKETSEGWCVILKAGNHKEIARSCPYASEAAALASIGGLTSWGSDTNTLGLAAAAGATALAATDVAIDLPEVEPTLTAGEAAGLVVEEAKVEEVKVEEATDESVRASGFGVAAGTLEETGFTNDSTGQTTHEAEGVALAAAGAAAAAAATPEPPKEEQKMPSSSYDLEDNYLSCGAYTNKSASKYDGFVSFTDDRTKKHYFAMMDAKSGKIALRSEGYQTTAARDAGIESVIANRDIKERYDTISTKSGQHFVILKAANGKEIARSCGNRDKGALWALFPFLSAAGGVFPWKAAAATAAVAATAAAAKTVVPTPVPTPVPAPKVEKTMVAQPIEPTRVGTPVSAVSNEKDRSGIPGWLWGLLGAALLAGLLWWMLRGCSDDKTTVDTSAPTVTSADTVKAMPLPVDTVAATTPPPPPPVEDTTTVKPAETAPVAASASTGVDCGCDMGRDPVFMRYAYEPIELKKLGSNTEFGNSHGLTPTQFYNKLNRAYKSNKTDRDFLNRIFKSMGYRNGWAAATPDLFTEATVPYGTVGNIGYSKQHRTQYSVLNLSEHDQKAFRIKAKNGCDLHFMKTCGNHMFFCTK